MLGVNAIPFSNRLDRRTFMYSIQFKEEALLPRERLLAVGAEKLSNQELLAILIRTGTKNEPVSVLSQHLLQHFSFHPTMIVDKYL